jgi:MFS superfamily sulfate permease-like transporter
VPTTLLSGLRGYQWGWLRSDLIAGGTVAAYLVPQAMAYAQLAGLPAVAGLWAVLGPLAVYAVMGSSQLLSVGPESTTALMTAIAVGAVAGGDRARYILLRRSHW